ncbi:MAG: hypothetical protein ACJA17_000035 [Polaribacter sp.]|jgi:hypothetical protein
MTINKVDQILKLIGYYDSFEKLMDKKHLRIDFGKRLGILFFDSSFDADNNYTYNGFST